MRKLNEAEILAWMKQPGHRMFRYQIHARLLGMLLLIAGVSFVLSLVVGWTQQWDADILRMVITVALSINILLWIRAVGSVLFVGRNYLGISDQELLIVRGKEGTAFSFDALREHNIDWHDRPPLRSSSYLPLRFQGKNYKIRLLSPYYSLEHFAAFLARLLEQLDAHAPSSKDER